MRLTISIFFFFFVGSVMSQTLSQNRSVDWTLAGLRIDTSFNLQVVDMQSLGVFDDGFTANDSIITNFIDTFSGIGAILDFPPGDFLFNTSIVLPSNYIIKGKGADSTIFLMDLGGSGNAIVISGFSTSDTTAFVQSVSLGDNHIVVYDSSGFQEGDWVRIIQYDLDLVTSSWAEGTVGQIVQIDSISNNNIWLQSPLRMDFDISRNPYIKRIIPRNNIGIECLKIMRLDDTAPQQSSNLSFRYAVNCWVKGIESDNCTFSHIKGEFCSNLYIAQSYFHHAFDYGGGGRGYGVVFQFTTGESLAEDNIFKHLRHSILVQAGANGNAFAYNYSLDPYWSSVPNDAAGDIVLHGNYVYSNLFEQNICRNIVIDNSHGPNGPYNTFFRNRSEGYGIFFSANNSPNQNFIGNEITNTSFPYSLVNYTILGTGHFIYGNNNKGTITPAGTQSLPDLSYAYTVKPDFIPLIQWAKIGTPNPLGTSDIPAKTRYINNSIFSSSCNNIYTYTPTFDKNNFSSVFPNPFYDVLYIESQQGLDKIFLFNALGVQLELFNINDTIIKLDLKNFASGIYFVGMKFTDGSSLTRRVVKLNAF
ncbi:MAG: T9SS type A sorting domain-containing protein [Saprospiraceae bacterium]|nr:T9SS type A sorting domain-containing protein [Saprospiraceae bacterium]